MSEHPFNTALKAANAAGEIKPPPGHQKLEAGMEVEMTAIGKIENPDGTVQEFELKAKRKLTEKDLI